jgi:hypothetical protein
VLRNSRITGAAVALTVLLSGAGTAAAWGFSTSSIGKLKTTRASSATAPGHPFDGTDVKLLGATADWYAIRQGPALPDGSTRLLVGNRTDPLTFRRNAVLSTAPVAPVASSDVTGPWLHWAVNSPNASRPWTMHAYDPLTGQEISDQGTLPPKAWTPDGWIDWDENSLTLTRHVFGGDDITLLTAPAFVGQVSQNPVTVRADGTGAVLSYDWVEDGVKSRRIGLITFDRPGIDILADDPYHTNSKDGSTYTLLGEAMLSPSTVSWVSWSGLGSATFLNRQPRSGGAVSTVQTPQYPGYQTVVAAGDRLAYLRDSDGQAGGHGELRVLEGQTWRTVALPGPAAGLSAQGDDFVTAVSGNATTAGVYAVGPGPATRVDAIARETSAFLGLSLSNGRLSYLDSANPKLSGTLWQRTVAPPTRAADWTLGAEHREVAVAPLATTDPLLYSRRPLSASAGRTLLPPLTTAQVEAGDYQLLDRNRRTRTLHLGESEDGGVRQSGPYSVVGSRVYRADGTLMLNLDHEWPGELDIFGPRVIYRTHDGSVRLRDLAAPLSASNPRLLMSARGCGWDCTGEVAIWGSTVAWVRKDGKVAIRTLPGRAVRVVNTGPVLNLRLSAGAMSWNPTWHEYSTSLLDLSSARSRPVSVPLRASEVDDHLIAGLDVSDRLRMSVRELPFGRHARYRPRLIGVLAARSLTPDVPGSPGTWRPQFDLTKPVTSVRLRLFRDGVAVRTLTGTAPDGSIRNLVWDGRDSHGDTNDGVYTWRLTATAVDGEGTLTAADGHSPVTGTVTFANYDDGKQ